MSALSIATVTISTGQMIYLSIPQRVKLLTDSTAIDDEKHRVQSCLTAKKMIVELNKVKQI